MEESEYQSGFDPTAAFDQFWTKMAGAMAGGGTPFQQDKFSPEMMRQMRSALFKAMSEYCEQYMRSAEFLQSMKQTMDNAVEYRQKINEMMSQAQDVWQTGSKEDIGSVLIALKQIEENLRTNLNLITERLEDLDERLTRLEQEKTQGASAARKETRARNAKKTAKKKSPSKRAAKDGREKKAGKSSS